MAFYGAVGLRTRPDPDRLLPQRVAEGRHARRGITRCRVGGMRDVT
jgi:hypothetical protein